MGEHAPLKRGDKVTVKYRIQIAEFTEGKVYTVATNGGRTIVRDDAGLAWAAEGGYNEFQRVQE